MPTENPIDATVRLQAKVLELQADLAMAREAAFREAAGLLHKMRMAEREWLPATGLHKGEQELHRVADEARQPAAGHITHRPPEGNAA